MLYFNDNIFDDLFGCGYKPTTKEMKSDLLESKGAYLLTIDIPGVKKENVSLEYDDNVLTVTAHKDEEDLKDGKYIAHERYFGDFSRTYAIAGIDAEGIKAKFENGVLEVVLPKAQIKETKKMISIE